MANLFHGVIHGGDQRKMASLDMSTKDVCGSGEISAGSNHPFEGHERLVAFLL